MTEERIMVMTAVIEGQISDKHVTLKEIYEFEDMLFEEFASRYTPFATWETLQ